MRAAVITALVTVLSACGAPSVSTQTSVTPEAQAKAKDLASQAAALFAERRDPQALRQAVDLWEQALAQDPGDVTSAVMVARSLQLLGEGFLQREPAEQRTPLYERGQQAALRALEATSPRFAELIGQGVAIETAVDALQPTAAPLVYWYAMDLGSYARAKGAVEGLKQKDRLVTLMTWVRDRDPRYHFYGADRFFGAYYAAVPEAFGGSLDKSRAHFQAAIDGAPEYTGTYLLMAAFYATKASDRPLFDRLLGQVESAQPCKASGQVPCVIPGWEPETEIDQQRAAVLEKRAPQLF